MFYPLEFYQTARLFSFNKNQIPPPDGFGIQIIIEYKKTEGSI